MRASSRLSTRASSSTSGGHACTASSGGAKSLASANGRAFWPVATMRATRTRVVLLQVELLARQEQRAGSAPGSRRPRLRSAAVQIAHRLRADAVAHVAALLVLVRGAGFAGARELQADEDVERLRAVGNSRVSSVALPRIADERARPAAPRPSARISIAVIGERLLVELDRAHAPVVRIDACAADRRAGPRDTRSAAAGAAAAGTCPRARRPRWVSCPSFRLFVRSSFASSQLRLLDRGRGERDDSLLLVRVAARARSRSDSARGSSRRRCRDRPCRRGSFSPSRTRLSGQHRGLPRLARRRPPASRRESGRGR